MNLNSYGSRLQFSIRWTGSISNHKWKVSVLDSIAHVNISQNIRVASVIGVESWPQMAFKSCNCPCRILLERPWVLREVFVHWVEAVWVVYTLTSGDHLLNFDILWCPRVLPVLKLLCIFLGKSTESLIFSVGLCWGVLPSTLRNGAIVFNLTHNVGKSIEFSNGLLWHDNTKLSINHFGSPSLLEEDRIKLSSEKIVYWHKLI